MWKQKSKKQSDKTSARSVTPEERRRLTFERAVKLLATRSRSIAELRERLMQGRHATKPLVEEVIARLRQYGYLDDQQFALSFASSKVKLRSTGRRRLERDLSLKKVDPAIVDEALDQVFAETTEEELINRAIEKRIRLRGRPKTREDAKSLFDHLLRQGFPFELVSEKVRSVSRADVDD